MNTNTTDHASPEQANPKHINKVGVIGAGVMGAGLSQALIETGHQVVLIDIAPDALEKSMATIQDSLRIAKMMKRIPKETDLQALRQQVYLSTNLSDLADVDFVVENATEKWSIKASIYPQIDSICKAECVFAANTSAIPISSLAALTQRPDKILGMHFMNPVPQKATVETIRSIHTSEATIAVSQNLLAQMNKRAIIVNDKPGFVSNRISHLFMNEAIWVVQDEVACAKDVDDIFIECYGHTMGPLATADLIGLDTVLHTLKVLQDNYSDEKFAPAPLLVQMVAAGKLGRKSGEGFFSY
ncbi:MAG: 3-hydroxybutyryl-CoA dehydrogenase [Alteromonadaceae bacterium]|nr:MAG: 3-hydroxybutyryl-CoA dehydrogenase [Alteromonadaceae bacterium]